MDERTSRYADNLSRMIQVETVSEYYQEDKSKFLHFHEVLKEIFPHIFAATEYENFGGSFLLRWKGLDPDAEPVLFMNHHDVVEATGSWEHGAFSGDITEDRLWGRGTLDTKGGLWGMLQAADELAAEGFAPKCDIYFESSCTEEVDGTGCKTIAATLKERGIHFRMSLDEGGMIMYDPIGGADGTFAMVGVGEKGCTDLKLTARSNGGHASTPGKNTPLVRLGRLMAACDDRKIFDRQISEAVMETLRRLSGSMHGILGFIMGHPKLFKPLILSVAPSISPTVKAMLQTTVAFTMAEGSGGANVIPEEAWVMGNMRYSHHQGQKGSIDALKALAEKYDIEVSVDFPGVDTRISDYRSQEFALVEEAVSEIFPGVMTVPYVANVCSDSRYMELVCDKCFRFTPFIIDEAQLESIHGLNENICLSCLAPAVDFYRYLMQRV